MFADVPMGQEVTQDGITFYVMPFPLLPGQVPEDLRTFGLLVSVENNNPGGFYYAVATVTTKKGDTYTLWGCIESTTSGYSVIVLSTTGDDIVTQVNDLQIIRIAKSTQRTAR